MGAMNGAPNRDLGKTLHFERAKEWCLVDDISYVDEFVSEQATGSSITRHPPHMKELGSQVLLRRF